MAGLSPRQGLGQKIGLFLVVALKANPVARLQYRFEERADLFGCDDLSLGESGRALKPGFTVACLTVPVAHGAYCSYGFEESQPNRALTVRKRTEGPIRQPRPVWKVATSAP